MSILKYFRLIWQDASLVSTSLVYYDYKIIKSGEKNNKKSEIIYKCLVLIQLVIVVYNACKYCIYEYIIQYKTNQKTIIKLNNNKLGTWFVEYITV